MAESSSKVKPNVKPKRRRLRRFLIGLGIGIPATLVALWIAVHRVEWLGPLISNSLRAVIGAEAVTWIQDRVYGVEDGFNRFWRKEEKPKAYWEVPKASAEREPTPVASAGDAGPPPLPPFRPKDVGPVHTSWSAPGDGQWVAVRDSRRPKEPTFLFKTLLHPDRNRSWAELFVVAVDLRRVTLHAVPGYREPKATLPEAKELKRPAKIPVEHHEELLAAFNGGFMAEHGAYGMMVEGMRLLPPRKGVCTIAEMKTTGELRIATWDKLEAEEPKMNWYRQAPNCMYEDGKMHPALHNPEVRRWGATLEGDTVIRRSAIGIDASGKVLYVGITNHTTARAIAQGMFHAGAKDVAQLDVNWSYPKFVLFEPGDAGAERQAVPLAKGFEFSTDEYIRKRSLRDFFYLLRKPTPP